MKRFFSVCFVILIGVVAYCQKPVLSSELNPEFRYSALKGEVFYSAYRQVKGSAYLLDDWTTGTIFLKNSQAIPDVQIKFDIYSHRILVYQDYLKRIVIPEKADVAGFELDIFGKTHTFKSVPADLTNQKTLSQNFLEVLTEGNISFYKLYFCKILPLKTPEMPYIDEFNQTENYYLFYNGSYINAKTKKSFLIRKFPEYKVELKKYIRENKLKMKNEAHFALAVSYLSQLREMK